MLLELNKIFNYLLMVKRIVFCETCEREVELRRKDFEQKYNEIICFLTLFTLGLGYVILKYIRKKDTCPFCETRFDLKKLKEVESKQLFENSVHKTQKKN